MEGNMKGILYSICIGSLAWALTAQGEQVQGSANVDAKAKARSTAKVHATTSAKTNATTSMRSRRNMSDTRFRDQMNANANINRNNMRTNRVRTHNERNMAVNQNTSLRSRQRFNESGRARSSLATNRKRNMTLNRNRNVTVNQNQNVVINRNRVSFSEAVNLHRHEFHDRDFWRRHFRIVIINNNAFFFDAGFWFPAWGYFPGAYYPYDGPIYGYNGLTPDQVVVNAQVQLQRDGYYAGPIDGVLGPITRHALAAFQADHGLAVTAAIDEATVSTLGLT
jgi:hypothetical protein